MNELILSIAWRFGVPLSSRSCTDSYFYDGKTIATTYRKDGQLLPIPDFNIIHNIGHWVVAETWHRDLPEFGMCLSFEFGATGGLNLDQQEQAADGLLDIGEQNHLEAMAYFLGYNLCLLARIPIPSESQVENSFYPSNPQLSQKAIFELAKRNLLSKGFFTFISRSMLLDTPHISP